MSSEPHIRPATESDLEMFYDICLRTCDNGDDGSHLHDDKAALGNIYVGPYLRIEPQFALALEDDQGVCGYCLATPDSRSFYQRFVHEWLPPIQRELHAPGGPQSGWSVTQQLHHLLLNPGDLTYFPLEFSPWPAHIHVDLLPRAQGRGKGRELMETQMGLLRDAGAVGVHLCVAPGNARALAFYQKLCFTELPFKDHWPPDTVYIGRTLAC